MVRTKNTKTPLAERRQRAADAGSGTAAASPPEPEAIRFKPRPSAGGADQTATVLIAHLPLDFEEAALRKYLSQFGEITRLKVARTSKAGASRGFAFVEFRYREVAEIVVRTMHGYTLSGKTLQASLMKEPNPGLFAKRKTPTTDQRRASSNEAYDQQQRRSITSIVHAAAKDMQRRLLLEKRGIDFVPAAIVPQAVDQKVLARMKLLETAAKKEKQIRRQTSKKSKLAKKKSLKTMQKRQRFVEEAAAVGTAVDLPL